MGVWYILSVCGICISIWGVAQLGIMGVAYGRETVMLIKDVEPLKYESFDEYIITCEKNFKIAAHNCFVAAYAYVWILAASVLSLLLARFYGMWSARRRLEKDESYCIDSPSKWKELERKEKIHIN